MAKVKTLQGWTKDWPNKENTKINLSIFQVGWAVWIILRHRVILLGYSYRSPGYYFVWRFNYLFVSKCMYAIGNGWGIIYLVSLVNAVSLFS